MVFLLERKVKYSNEEKLNAVYEYLNGNESIHSIAHRLGIDLTSVKLWINKYKAMGKEGFSTYKQYSKSEKEQDVTAYLTGEGLLMEICNKFEIHSATQFRRWIKKYNGHELPGQEGQLS